MNLVEAWCFLAETAIGAATTEADRLAVFDALARLGDHAPADEIEELHSRADIARRVAAAIPELDDHQMVFAGLFKRTEPAEGPHNGDAHRGDSHS
jgi:hypothetical protein